MFVLPMMPGSDDATFQQFNNNLVVTNADPLAKWSCAYFVKQGLYQGAILKFLVEFPLSYPKSRPSVRFLSPAHIYHPLVHPKSGEMNLELDFPKWEAGKHWAINVLLSVKKAIHLEPYYSAAENLCFNRQARADFCDNFRQAFLPRVQQATRLSQEERYKDLDNEGQAASLLKFQEPSAVHEIVSKKINEAVDSVAVEREMEMEDEDQLIDRKKEELKKWFINNYPEELNKFNKMEQPKGLSPGAGVGDLSFQNLVNLAQEIDERTQEQ
mmetsp:Transcript_27760/g.42049  ORF Transcript_27760/g.42049 Transcript_27760/m.42049 type:complete len:270 (-) Transcript_27760:3-812(-)